MSAFPSSRSKAMVSGSLYYLSRLPCRNGHVAKRQTSNGRCCACAEAGRRDRGALCRAEASKIRREAIKAGKAHYFTGRPCKHGHVCERSVGNGCMECSRIQSRTSHSTGSDWQTQHPKEHKEYLRKYQEAHHDDLADKHSKWREDHLESLREAKAVWYRANKATVLARVKTRKARLKGADGSFSADDVAKLLTQQHGCCAVCKCSIYNGYHIDHIIPLIRGGSNWPANLQLLCLKCNLSKGTKDFGKWMDERKRRIARQVA